MNPYAVVIVAWQRPLGLLRLAAQVAAQSPAPRTVLVWHNGDTPNVAGVVNVRASVNLGCRVRHAVALALTEPTVVYVDDDVSILSPAVCPELVAAAAAGGLVGWRGRLLAPTAAPYSEGCDAQRPGPVHVVKGIIHAAPRMLAPESLGPPDSGCHDDICLSAAAAMATGQLPRLVDFERGAVGIARESIGYEDRPEHWRERDAVCLAWMARGWAPFNGSAETRRRGRP